MQTIGSPAYVEAGVDDDRATGLLLEVFQEAVVASVSLGIHGLHAGAVVHVGDGRHQRALRFQFVEAVQREFVRGRRGSRWAGWTGATRSM